MEREHRQVRRHLGWLIAGAVGVTMLVAAPAAAGRGRHDRAGRAHDDGARPTADRRDDVAGRDDRPQRRVGADRHRAAGRLRAGRHDRHGGDDRAGATDTTEHGRHDRARSSTEPVASEPASSAPDTSGRWRTSEASGVVGRAGLHPARRRRRPGHRPGRVRAAGTLGGGQPVALAHLRGDGDHRRRPLGVGRRRSRAQRPHRAGRRAERHRSDRVARRLLRQRRPAHRRHRARRLDPRCVRRLHRRVLHRWLEQPRRRAGRGSSRVGDSFPAISPWSSPTVSPTPAARRRTPP